MSRAAVSTGRGPEAREHVTTSEELKVRNGWRVGCWGRRDMRLQSGVKAWARRPHKPTGRVVSVWEHDDDGIWPQYGGRGRAEAEMAVGEHGHRQGSRKDRQEADLHSLEDGLGLGE